MKIKITKTVDDNQVPAEVRRMLDQNKNVLMYTLPDKMSAMVRASLSTEGMEFFSTIELLDSFRQDLASFDENLNELQNVLVGYRNILMPPAPQSEHHHDEECEHHHDEEWLANEEAEYEKFMSRVDGTDEVENEKG
tara:strand:+ start:265 stop:675 length:411 start_codon:yes stop_codon:yes gene_type:complete